MAEVREVLEAASTIVVVDWPSAEVPAALVRAGYHVFGRGPAGYGAHSLAAEPASADDGRSFALGNGTYLVTRPIERLPVGVDVVVVYRPPEEQPAIARWSIELGARLLWVEPGGASSDEARSVVESAGLLFVDGVSITAML